MPRHIAIIDPGVKTPELPSFNRMVLMAPIALTYHLPALYGYLPEDDPELAGIMILGSKSSVHDDLPWQETLREWVLSKIRSAVPTLGICFGHQLIAHAFGAKVGFLYPDHKKRQGFFHVQFKANPLWGDGTEGDLFSSHREAVTSCPKGFLITASSREVPIEGLAHEQLPLWTFQPHIEATNSFAQNRGITQSHSDASFSFGHSLIRHFFSMVKKG